MRLLGKNADDLYNGVRDLPIVSPHGHCDPAWFSQNKAFPNPAELLITPDHYVFRMLYSQGISLESLGIGQNGHPAEPRKIFRVLAANWHLFLGTASRHWLNHTFKNVFGITEKLAAETADVIYDQIADRLAQDDFRPRSLFEKFGIEVLATTDGANDPLDHHQEITRSDWSGQIIPTFRPDGVLNPANEGFAEQVRVLGEITSTAIDDLDGYMNALRKRRAFFIRQGATATDHDVPTLHTNWLPRIEIEELYTRAIEGRLTVDEKLRFYGHMLIEMAQMSIDDGLVMQLHVGVARSTNALVLDNFGPDKGADIPKPTNWVNGLHELLNRVGNSPNLTLILFTLDEATYARELAPMAGHWPALRLGPPWWFHDTSNGIQRYLDSVVESAGYWNLAGFNDDTRAFMSIPARHDLWRQEVCIHLAGQVDKGRFGRSDAKHIAELLSTGLARQAYNLERHA